MHAELRIAEETPRQPEVEDLLGQSDAHMSALYPAESNHPIHIDALAAPGVRFFVVRRDGRAVGCGALLLAGDGTAELKRMFLIDSARGLGAGRALLDAIERAGRRAGVRVIRLETGIRNHAALALYRRCGYCERPPFGTYRADPYSVFMEKALPERS